MSENDITIKCALGDAPISRHRASVSPPRSPVKRVSQVNWTRLRAAAAGVTRDVTASLDIVQNVGVKLMEMSQEKRDEIECLEAYALRAVRNSAFNWRRTRNRDASADGLNDLRDEYADPARDVIDLDQAFHLLERLPEKYQVPFVRCRFLGYDAEEVADDLGISVEAVWKRVQRAFDLLQQEEAETPGRKSRIRGFFKRKEQK